MTELRSVDPRTLTPDPENPRRAPSPPEMDAQLRASILAIGIIEPPVCREKNGNLLITAGARRVEQAIAAGLAAIDVLVRESDDATAQMESLSENAVRAPMTSVDIWRAIERLEKLDWTEQAIADALALPVRTIRRLKLLARIHPPMLDVMNRGDMPSEEQLRTIAAATLEEQAQVWKKHKPKKNEETEWYGVAHALSKRRMPFSAAKFDDALAEKYGVAWHDDLFVPAGEDGRYTTNVEGFFGAQQEWLQNNLPERGVLLPQDEYGQPTLPHKAEKIWGKPGRHDTTGHYLDPQSGEVRTVVYRMPSENKPKAGKQKEQNTTEVLPRKPRPDVTQKGSAVIGDLRTDALHEALRQNEIDDITLVALLVLALGGNNVSVQSGASEGAWDRDTIRDTIVAAGVITADPAAVRSAAREMLVRVLSCRDNMSNSGIGARVAGEVVGATALLPTMATDEFLSNLSRQALEREAAANGVRVEARVKDTRARFVQHFTGTTWHYPGALFALTAEERKKGLAPAFDPNTSDPSTADGDDGYDEAAD